MILFGAVLCHITLGVRGMVMDFSREFRTMRRNSRAAKRSTIRAGADGWYDGGANSSCDVGCGNVGLVCTNRALYLHNHDVDSSDQLLALIKRSGGNSGATTCDEGAVTAGEPPVWEEGSPGCVMANSNRTLASADCKLTPTSELQHRLCYCHTPQVCEDFQDETSCNDATAAGLLCAWATASSSCAPQTGSAACNASQAFRIKPRSEAYSNLAGLGPAEPTENESTGMKILDVFPGHTQQIDLMIRVVGGDYQPHDTEKNELHGTFGNINFNTSTYTVFKFEFVEAEDEILATLPGDFYFTIADVDRQRNGEATEKVTVAKALKNYTSAKSAMEATLNANNEWEFASSVFGSQVNNPTHPCDLTSEQASESVTYLMPSSANEFEVTFTVTGGWDGSGRNIAFAGATNLVCPREELEGCINATLPMPAIEPMPHG